MRSQRLLDTRSRHWCWSRALKSKGRREADTSAPLSPSLVSPTRKLLTTAIQRALQHLLEPIHLERLR
jgi:hypothetical protein